MMHKVRIDRDDCISCGTCWTTCPEFFEQNPYDSHSQVVEKYRIVGNTGEGVAPEIYDQNRILRLINENAITDFRWFLRFLIFNDFH